MKVFIVFALFHLFSVGIDAHLCEEKGADLRAAEEYKDLLRQGANFLFGHCYSFDIDALLFEGSCSDVFDQLFCYRQLAQAYYGNRDVVTYQDLAAVDYTEKLGDAACTNGLACYATVKAMFLACGKESDGFVDGVIEAVENAYRLNGRASAKEFISAKTDSILEDIVNLVLDNKFQSIQDVRDVLEHLVNDNKLSDAQLAENAAVEAAVAWCESNCTAVTGSFLEKIFKHMNKGRCRDASKFCGNCQQRADKFLDRHEIPCCLDNALQHSIASVTYIKEKFSRLIDDFKTYIPGKLGKRAIEKAKRMRKRLIKEMNCIEKSYKGVENDCESA